MRALGTGKGIDEGAGRAFAVGAGHLNDLGVCLGKGEVFAQETGGVFKPQFDSETLGGIEPVDCFGVGHESWEGKFLNRRGNTSTPRCENFEGWGVDFLEGMVLLREMGIGSVAIVGAGAIGSYYGCRMAQAGHDVRFLLRSDFEEVKKNGFALRKCGGGLFGEGASGLSKCGRRWARWTWWWWLGRRLPTSMRSGDCAFAARETRILTLQNGLGNVELLGRSLWGRTYFGRALFCMNQPECVLEKLRTVMAG